MYIPCGNLPKSSLGFVVFTFSCCVTNVPVTLYTFTVSMFSSSLLISKIPVVGFGKATREGSAIEENLSNASVSFELLAILEEAPPPLPQPP